MSELMDTLRLLKIAVEKATSNLPIKLSAFSVSPGDDEPDALTLIFEVDPSVLKNDQDNIDDIFNSMINGIQSDDLQSKKIDQVKTSIDELREWLEEE